MAAAMALLGLAQRSLSKHARFVRRSASRASVEFDVARQVHQWSREQLLMSWELPLQLLAATTVMLAAALLVWRI